jgi:hypothetical protein
MSQVVEVTRIGTGMASTLRVPMQSIEARLDASTLLRLAGRVRVSVADLVESNENEASVMFPSGTGELAQQPVLFCRTLHDVPVIENGVLASVVALVKRISFQPWVRAVGFTPPQFATVPLRIVIVRVSPPVTKPSCTGVTPLISPGEQYR